MTIASVQAQLLSDEDRARVEQTIHELEERRALPEAVQEPVLRLLRLASEGRPAYVMAEEEGLTTTQAAKLLGVSRPFLTRLLETGRIPFHKTGRDRRIAVSDMVEYKRRRDEAKASYAASANSYKDRRNERLAGMSGMTGEQASDLGFG